MAALRAAPGLKNRLAARRAGDELIDLAALRADLRDLTCGCVTRPRMNEDCLELLQALGTERRLIELAVLQRSTEEDPARYDGEHH